MATRRIAALVLLAAVVPIAAKKQKLSEYLEGTLWNWNDLRSAEKRCEKYKHHNYLIIPNKTIIVKHP